MFKKKIFSAEKTALKNSDIPQSWNFVYTVFDKVENHCIGLFYNPTDAGMLRSSLPQIIMDYNFRDIEIRRIAKFDTVSGITEPLAVKVITLDTYLFPHSRLSPKGEDVSMESMSDTLKSLKSSINKNLPVEDKKVANE